MHGPGIDNPIAWYEGSAVNNTTRRFLMADERGSVVSITDSAGATIAINSYDEYGIPAPGNVGRFGYTGQTWLSEIGMWYYKARLYSPTLGRFMQSDPIGYADGMNWYNYVGSDPVNFVDPLGLGAQLPPPIDVFGSRAECQSDSQKVPDSREKSGYRCEPMPNFLQVQTVSENSSGIGASLLIPCNPKKKPSTASKIAKTASNVGIAADVVTLAAGVAGLTTAPSGGGPVVAAVVGAGASVVSRGAAVVSTVAYLHDGDYVNAIGSAVGIVAGSAAGAAGRQIAARSMASTRALGTVSASQARTANLVGEGSGAAVGKIVGDMGCP